MKKQGLLLTNHRGYITGLGPQFGYKYTVTGRDRKSSPIKGSIFIGVKRRVPRIWGFTIDEFKIQNTGRKTQSHAKSVRGHPGLSKSGTLLVGQPGP